MTFLACSTKRIEKGERHKKKKKQKKEKSSGTMSVCNVNKLSHGGKFYVLVSIIDFLSPHAKDLYNTEDTLGKQEN